MLDPSKYGVVLYDELGKIERFIEKPKDFISNKINAGLYLFNTSIIKRIQVNYKTFNFYREFAKIVGLAQAYEH